MNKSILINNSPVLGATELFLPHPCTDLPENNKPLCATCFGEGSNPATPNTTATNHM